MDGSPAPPGAPPPAREDAVEVIEASDPRCPVLLTCEHASEHLPPPFAWPDADAHLRGTHWAFDLGARDLCRELSERLGAAAVLSRFSRLLADPNRPLDAADLFRATAEGRPVELNREISREAREARLSLWRAYHEALDAAVRGSAAGTLLAVHTFTPIYEGAPRAVEVGVLFDTEEALALGLAEAFRAAAFRVELNEPYSGRAGLMYSVERHAKTHGRRAVEIEVRQDLAVDPGARRRIVEAAARCFSAAPGAHPHDGARASCHGGEEASR